MAPPIDRNGLPDYERPPVVETVLGVQFDSLPKFTNAHLGTFWETQATKPRPSISPALIQAVPTRIDTEAPVTRDGNRDHAARAKWQALIAKKLMEWLRDRAQFEDEGVDAPNRTIVRLSIDLAEQYRDEGRPAPDSIVPDPNGGIVFERGDNGVSEVIHIWDDGVVEYQQFHGCRLVERHPIFRTPSD